MNTKGKLLIFSAPSGSGKTTLVKHLLGRLGDDLSFSISATTRQPRGEEKDGKDYYFISQEEFEQKIDNQEFAEYEEVYKGTYYGTLNSEIQRIWNQGKTVIFDIDVEGGLNLKKKFGAAALSIFVQPPSFEILQQRLRGRGTDSEEKLQERFAKAHHELTYANRFDVVLLNQDLDAACAEVERIVADFLKS